MAIRPGGPGPAAAACAWASSDAAVDAAAAAVASARSSSCHASFDHTPDPSILREAVLHAAAAHAEWKASDLGMLHDEQLAERKAAFSALHMLKMRSSSNVPPSTAQEQQHYSEHDDGSRAADVDASSGGLGWTAVGSARPTKRGRSTAKTSNGILSCNLCFHVDPRGQHVPLGQSCRLRIQRMVKEANGDTSVAAEGWRELQLWKSQHPFMDLNGRPALPTRAQNSKTSSTSPTLVPCSLCGRHKGEKRKSLCAKFGSDRCLDVFFKSLPSPQQIQSAEDANDTPEDVDLAHNDELLRFLGLVRGVSSTRSDAAKRPIVIFGAPGTGKSFTVVRLVRVLRALLGSVSAVALVAAYGVVAQNVQGVTLHSWAGIGPCDDDQINASELLARIKGRALLRWRRAQVLVIDDGSIVSKELLDALEHVARIIRGRDVFFGGLLLVLQLDVEQLLPVSTEQAPRHPLFPIHARERGSKIWETIVEEAICIHLQQQHRFRNDPLLSSLQHGLRCSGANKNSSNMTDDLYRRVRALPSTDLLAPRDLPPHVKPTWLCPRRTQVTSTVSTRPPRALPRALHAPSTRPPRAPSTLH